MVHPDGCTLESFRSVLHSITNASVPCFLERMVQSWYCNRSVDCNLSMWTSTLLVMIYDIGLKFSKNCFIFNYIQTVAFFVVC